MGKEDKITTTRSVPTDIADIGWDKVDELLTPDDFPELSPATEDFKNAVKELDKDTETNKAKLLEDFFGGLSDQDLALVSQKAFSKSDGGHISRQEMKNHPLYALITEAFLVHLGLSNDIDGTYDGGATPENKIKELQQKVGVKPDGLFGPVTLKNAIGLLTQQSDNKQKSGAGSPKGKPDGNISPIIEKGSSPEREEMGYYDNETLHVCDKAIQTMNGKSIALAELFPEKEGGKDEIYNAYKNSLVNSNIVFSDAKLSTTIDGHPQMIEKERSLEHKKYGYYDRKNVFHYIPKNAPLKVTFTMSKLGEKSIEIKDIIDKEGRFDMAKFKSELKKILEQKKVEAKAKKDSDKRGEIPAQTHQEGKEQNKTSLSHEDFIKYFGGENFQQSNIGDCWLLAVVDSLCNLSNYENIIRSSVELSTDNDGVVYHIKLPLGNKNAKEYIVNCRDMEGQMAIDGTKLDLIQTDLEGLSALVYALGQSMTGQRNFDFNDLWGGEGTEAISHLISGMTMYSEDNSNGRGLRKRVKDLFGYRGRLETALKIFDPQKHILTVSVKQEYGYDNIQEVGAFDSSNHLVSVEKVNKTNGGEIISATVSNPRDSSKSYNVKYPECLDYFNSYDLGSYEAIEGLGGTTTGSTAATRGQDEVTTEEYGSQSSLNAIIQNQSSTNDDERLSRGDVIIKEREGNIYINSWGKEDTYLSYNDKNSTSTIHIANREITLNDIFSDTCNDIKNIEYKQHLYPPRLSVFINKMRHNYIDTQTGDTTNNNPFALYKGKLVFDDEYETTSGKRQRSEWLTGDDTVTILADRSLLGISDDDTSTKDKIVDFLNQLYLDKKNNHAVT